MNNMKKISTATIFVVFMATSFFFLMIEEACSKILEYNKAEHILAMILSSLFCICVNVFIHKEIDKL